MTNRGGQPAGVASIGEDHATQETVKVRELYAVQLSGTHQTRNATAWGQIRTWAERHTGFDIPSDGGTTQLARP